MRNRLDRLIQTMLVMRFAHKRAAQYARGVIGNRNVRLQAPVNIFIAKRYGFLCGHVGRAMSACVERSRRLKT